MLIRRKPIVRTNPKRRATEADVKFRKKKQTEEEERRGLDDQYLDILLGEGEEPITLSDDTDEAFSSTSKLSKEEEEDSIKLVDWFLNLKLGNCSQLVTQYLDRPKPKRNMMPVINTAKSRVRHGVTPAATADITTGFLKALIAADILPPEMSYLACDPSKIERARKTVMANAIDLDQSRYTEEKLVGLRYDGRKDKHTRAMVTDSCGTTRMKMVKKEYITISEEPKGRYLSHFIRETCLDSCTVTL